MINQLVRYAPLLERLAADPRTILEVGSGSDGIASYLGRPCFGVEIRFPSKPVPQLRACAGTATALPFRNRSVDVVLIMDTMEHIPPELRHQAIAEAARVAKDEIVVGGPMGADARHGDDVLAADYARHGRPIPTWLAEHLERRAPDVSDVVGWLESCGWSAKAEGNEHLGTHLALMRFEASRYGGRVTDRLRTKLPSLSAKAARVLRRPPYYSWIVTARRA